MSSLQEQARFKYRWGQDFCKEKRTLTSYDPSGIGFHRVSGISTEIFSGGISSSEDLTCCALSL